MRIAMLLRLPEQFPIQLDRSTALGLCFNAFSSREPASTSLENTLHWFAGRFAFRLCRTRPATPVIQGFAVILTAAAWRGYAKAGLTGPAWRNRNERRIDAG
ncbi:hypothetical protein [Bosea vaviloviae]|uniref:hypothetical protein n=1 Tax=Bosea vaviloviae TaxID=1526658 RepID=UPI0011E05202|nr:hypothetical protein [Bosea vaviloviae]